MRPRTQGKWLASKLEKMNPLLFGLAFFIVGFGLIIFNEPTARVTKAMNGFFGMGSPSLRFYRIGLYISGALLGIYGLLFMLHIFNLKSG